VSVVEQKSPSLHVFITSIVKRQPVATTHVSSVHRLPSLHATAALLHPVAGTQVSVVHMSESSHDLAT
jgi:hypothetical protein